MPFALWGASGSLLRVSATGPSPSASPEGGSRPPAQGPARLLGVRTRIPEHPVFCVAVTGDPALGAQRLGASRPRGAHSRAQDARTRVSPPCAPQRSINLTLWQLEERELAALTPATGSLFNLRKTKSPAHRLNQTLHPQAGDGQSPHLTPAGGRPPPPAAVPALQRRVSRGPGSARLSQQRDSLTFCGDSTPVTPPALRRAGGARSEAQERMGGSGFPRFLQRQAANCLGGKKK